MNKIKNITLSLVFSACTFSVSPSDKSLNLDATYLPAEFITHLSWHCKKLKKINFSGCKYVEWDSINWKLFTALEEVSFNNTEVSASVINDMLSNCKKIKKLSIVGCKNILWDNIELQKLANLEEIILNNEV